MQAPYPPATIASHTSQECPARLNAIYRRLHEAQCFEEALPIVEREILDLLQAERLTVYQRRYQVPELVSRFKTGAEIAEYRLPLTPTSVASFVALTQRPVRIDNAYDETALARIHPRLRFDSSFDQRSGFKTQSMIAVPIRCRHTLLGVLQVINRIGGGAFTDLNLRHAHELSLAIGQKFQYDLQATYGPFEHLIQSSKITVAQLQELQQRAEQEQASITGLLVSELKLQPEEIGESLERYYQVPFHSYDPCARLPRELFRSLKLSYLRQHCWVPIAGDREHAVILIDNPNDVGRVLEIQQLLGARDYELRVGLAEDIARYLAAADDEADEAAARASRAYPAEHAASDSAAATAEGRRSDSAPPVSEDEALAVQLVDRLIAQAISMHASDIHIEPGRGDAQARVRLRIDGVCRPVLLIPSGQLNAVVARIKILSRLDIAERRRPQDGKITTMARGMLVEVRVATVPTVHGEGAVLRILPSTGALPLHKLDLSARSEGEVKRLIERPHGIFLVVGPTGSGKTTTLHAVLGHINTLERKIWTAEDPVEITQPGLQQVQVMPRIGFDFAAALRSFLRADPDVILIGEMRDRETARIAVEASLTGHLVFSTLHTNSAPETISRLLDMGVDPLNFADAILGILAQRLVRTLCSSCKQAFAPAPAEYEQLVRIYGPECFPELKLSRDDLQLFRPAGCAQCGNTGYKGRTGIHELLVATPEIRHLISLRSEVAQIRSLALEQGMRTLLQDGVAKIVRGETDLCQLRRVCSE